MGQRLSPVIKLVESCNLACRYCYQEGELRPGQTMSMTTLERICSQLAENCPNPKPPVGAEATRLRRLVQNCRSSLSLLWYGGEPTLIGLAAFEQAIACAQRHLGHLGLEHSLQTNGLLIDENWAGYLREHDFRVRISLDGPEDLHDLARPRLGGQGSHARVVSSLRLLQSQGLPVRVACTVTRDSLARAAELVNYFECLGLEEIDFSPALCLSQSAEQHRAWINGQEFGRFLIDALEAWFSLPQTKLRIRSLASLIRKFHGLSPGYCKLEGQCSRYLTFGWDGSVYPCDEFSRQICLGNIQQQPLSEILRRRPSEPPPAPECQKCRWETTCPGSLCPFERAMNGDSARASILCDGWRLLQEHLAASIQA